MMRKSIKSGWKRAKEWKPKISDNGQAAATAAPSTDASAKASKAPVSSPTASANGESRAERLWKQAFNELTDDEKRLLDQFVPKDQRLATKLFQDAVDKLQTAQDVHESSQASTVVRYISKAAQLVLKFSSTVAAVAALEPHASIAWTAVSTILPLFAIPGHQDEAIAKGLHGIAFLLRALQVKSSLELVDPKYALYHSERVVYLQILQFEAALVQHEESGRIRKTYQLISDTGDWSKRDARLGTAYTEYVDIWQSLVEIEERQALRKHLQEKQNRLAQGELTKHLQNLDTNYLALKERKPLSEDRVNGTSEWFFSHPAYFQWLHDTADNLLWVTAAPGCGKSMLCKYLIDARRDLLFTKGRPEPFFCFYIFKDGDHNDAESCLKALLHQLLVQYERLAPYFDILSQRNIKDALDFGTLWSIFLQAVSDDECNRRGVICIIDGLDECIATDQRNLIDAIAKFFAPSSSTRSRPSFLKLIVTSRPYESIERNFYRSISDLESIRVDLADDDPVIGIEIDRYIDVTVKQRSELADMPLKWQQEVTTLFKSQKNRTYLYISIVLDEYWSPHWQLDSALPEPPQDVYDAYDKMLSRSKNQADARGLLHIILAAKEPLTVSEALIALHAFKDRRPERSARFHQDRIQQNEASRAKYVRDLCGLILSVVNGKVHFLHQTAREFLMHDPSSSAAEQESPIESLRWQQSFTVENSEYILGIACVNYLCLQKLEELDQITGATKQVSPQELPPFAWYATVQWNRHIQVGEQRLNTSQLDVICGKLLEDKNTEFIIWTGLHRAVTRASWLFVDQEEHIIDMRRLCDNNLQRAARLGLSKLVETLLIRQAAFDRSVNAEKGLIFLAAKGNHKSLIDWLIQSGHSIKSVDPPAEVIITTSNAYALAECARAGNYDMVQFLLSRGANQTRQALSEACYNYHKKNSNYRDIIQTILDRSPSLLQEELCSNKWVSVSDARARSKYTFTVANSEAAYRDLSLLQNFIKRGADLRATDSWGMTLLLNAVKFAEGHDEVEVVQFLLKHDAQLAEARCPNGQSIMHKAANLSKSNRPETSKSILELILECKGLRIGVNEKDNDGRTPLMSAVSFESQQALLAHGADLTAVDGQGMTALMHFVSSRRNFGQSDLQVFIIGGLSLKDTDKLGRDGFWHALCGGNITWILNNFGIQALQPDKRGITPLMIAAKHGVNFHRILSRVVDCSGVDDDGRTALHWLVIHSRASSWLHRGPKMLETLIEKGVDPLSRDKEGKTAWDYFVQRGLRLLDKGWSKDWFQFYEALSRVHTERGDMKPRFDEVSLRQHHDDESSLFPLREDAYYDSDLSSDEEE